MNSTEEENIDTLDDNSSEIINDTTNLIRININQNEWKGLIKKYMAGITIFSQK
jgi:hypothetical protein